MNAETFEQIMASLKRSSEAVQTIRDRMDALEDENKELREKLSALVACGLQPDAATLRRAASVLAKYRKEP